MEQVRCDRCDEEKDYYLVSKQRDGEQLCSSCVNEINAGIREQARQARATAPRCSCCNRRGTWTLSGVLLCGAHKSKVERTYHARTARYGALMLGAPAPSSDAVLEMAGS